MEGFISAILDVDNAARAEAERQYNAYKLASPKEVSILS
jgi:hypothetical protein